jgi:hypothetical protein
VVFKCTKHDLPCVVFGHGKYGLEVAILCARSFLKGEQQRKTSEFLKLK